MEGISRAVSTRRDKHAEDAVAHFVVVDDVDDGAESMTSCDVHACKSWFANQAAKSVVMQERC